MANEKRLIDANALLEEQRIMYHYSRIENAPTVDAVEVVHGEWMDTREIPSYSNKNIPVVECSKCRCFFCDIINNHHFLYHYCPNCGAKMDGGNEDD